jgi:LAO/AO transport system kinase
VSPVDQLVRRLRAGDQQATARALSWVERRSAEAPELLAALAGCGGRAHVVGVTGPPGGGKSTLVSAVTQEYRRLGRRVGILAVDPSSVYSGGAILGDRIRMGALAGDPGVFIRSLASRGALGGLSRAALDSVAVLDAAGSDVVVLETVGVGQAEVDVLGAAHTIVVVSVPGLGDGVQAMKAGLLEIADVHVVNKADREGAQRTVAELRDMLRQVHRRAGQWNVPIVKTVAPAGDGVAEVVKQVDDHRDWLARSGALSDRNRRIAAMNVRWAAQALLSAAIRPGRGDYERLVDDVAAGRRTAAAAARELLTTSHQPGESP